MEKSIFNSLFLFLIISISITGCFNDDKSDTPAASKFSGTWINPAYDGDNCQPSAKLVISSDGLSWTGYSNTTDIAQCGSTTVTNEGSYEGDPTWTKFKDTYYRLLKVDGSTLYFRLHDNSYDGAYNTSSTNYSYTKQ